MSSNKASTIDLFPEFDDDDRKSIIDALIEQDPDLRRVTRTSYFFFWFADISCLEKLKAMPKEDRKKALERTEFLERFDLPGIFRGLAQWTEAPNKRAASRSPARGRGDPNASKGALKQAMIRDDRLCIFTKYDEPGVYATRIVPFKLNGKTPHQEMWKLLKVFWGDKVAKWQEKLCVQCDDLSIDTEKVYNMLSLNGVIQQCWDAGWVAFRPISVNKENTSMKIKFHWIAVDNKVDELGKRLDKIKLNQIPPPLLDADFWCKRQSRMDRKRLWHQTENRLALDGDILTVTTDDPVKRPLPSMELLELQWILTRIAAVQGKADDDNQRD